MHTNVCIDPKARNFGIYPHFIFVETAYSQWFGGLAFLSNTLVVTEAVQRYTFVCVEPGWLPHESKKDQ